MSWRKKVIIRGSMSVHSSGFGPLCAQALVKCQGGPRLGGTTRNLGVRRQTPSPLAAGANTGGRQETNGGRIKSVLTNRQVLGTWRREGGETELETGSQGSCLESFPREGASDRRTKGQSSDSGVRPGARGACQRQPCVRLCVPSRVSLSAWKGAGVHTAARFRLWS